MLLFPAVLLCSEMRAEREAKVAADGVVEPAQHKAGPILVLDGRQRAFHCTTLRLP
jgi:hypothetical protein